MSQNPRKCKVTHKTAILKTTVNILYFLEAGAFRNERRGEEETGEDASG